MKIIADEPLLGELIARFRGQPYERHEHIGHGQKIVVWAHTLPGQRERHSENGGLRLLQEIVARPQGDGCRVAILGLLPAMFYGKWSYLTEDRYQQLPIARLTSGSLRFKGIHPKVRTLAIEREIELVSARIRHLYHEDARPAVRIALGAFAVGDIPFDGLKAVLKHEKVPMAYTRDWPAIEDDLEQLRLLQSRFGKAFSGANEPRTLVDILLIEDNPIARSSWQQVLNVVFEGWARKCSSPQPRMYRITTNITPYYSQQLGWNSEALSRLGLVLLDYELLRPSGSHEKPVYGGNMIPGIKNAALDVPIIMFTASDEASIVKWCVSRGASDYFVKELPERQDRESIGHYENLREMLRRQIEHNRAYRFTNSPVSARSLYRRYVTAGALHAQRIDLERNNTVKRDSVDFHLRQAFRFLFAEPFWAEDALEEENVWRPDPVHRLSRMHAFAAKEATLEFIRHAQPHREGSLAGLMPKTPEDKHVRLEEPPRKADSHQRRTALKISALSYLSRTLDLVIQAGSNMPSIGGKNLPTPHLPYVPPPQFSAPALPWKPGQGSHRAQSIQAASDFLRQCSNEPAGRIRLQAQHPVDVLFIDDMITEHSQWEVALRDGLAEARISLFGIHPGDFAQRSDQIAILRDKDVVLLDLRLPTPPDGLNALRFLKKVAPEVPVVIFTASHDSRPVRQAALAGAADYFLARSGRTPDGLSRRDELVRIVLGLENHWRTGRLRRSFLRIAGIEGASVCPKVAALLGVHGLANIRRLLQIAWAYLTWAEFDNRPGGGNSMAKAWDQWLGDALAGAHDHRSHGCQANVLVHCGLVIEGLGNLASGYASQQSTKLMKMLDRMRGQGSSFLRIWNLRNKAVHGDNQPLAIPFAQLCDELDETIALTEWFLQCGQQITI